LNAAQVEKGESDAKLEDAHKLIVTLKQDLKAKNARLMTTTLSPEKIFRSIVKKVVAGTLRLKVVRANIV